MLKLIKLLKPYSGYVLVATALLMISVSSIPSIPTLKIKAGHSTIRLDYLIHFCEYGFLTFLAFLTFSGKDFVIRPKKALIVITCLLIFAFLDEIHQKIVPGRSYNIIDFVSNALGVAGGWIFSFVVFRWARRT